ncbi:MAG: hypothetical protein AAFU85_17880 [Planctomycetota bacterium]
MIRRNPEPIEDCGGSGVRFGDAIAVDICTSAQAELPDGVTYTQEDRKQAALRKLGIAAESILAEDRQLFTKLFLNVQVTMFLLGVCAWLLSRTMPSMTRSALLLIMSIFGLMLSWLFAMTIRDSIDCLIAHKLSFLKIDRAIRGESDGEPEVFTIAPKRTITKVLPVALIAAWVLGLLYAVLDTLGIAVIQLVVK